MLDSHKTNPHAMVKGSAWMTFGSIFSRVLGAIYIIPWGIWLGTSFSQANSLFARGYNIYSLFLIISTAGIPSALSKQIAHYDAIGQEHTAQRLFHNAFALMLGLGAISAVIMWLAAPILAMQNGHVDARMLPIIHALCWPLLIIPPMSILRGYFQGHAQMAPSAISQLIEQVARVIYMLLATYWIMRVINGSYVQAVTHSTFAAFIGAIFALIYLLGVYQKNKPKAAAEPEKTAPKAAQRALLGLFHQALPFIVLNAAVVVYQFLDQYLFPYFMKMSHGTSETQINYLYGLFGFNSNKLTMIVISLASAMAATAIPLLAQTFSSRDFKGVIAHINSVLRLFLFVMLPGSLGMLALAQPLYRLFYRTSDLIGIRVLVVNALVAIIIGLFTVLIAVMQGLSDSKMAMADFGFGLIVKVAVMPLGIWAFGVYGPLVATGCGFAFSVWLMLRRLKKRFGLHYRKLASFTAAVFSTSALMTGLVYLAARLAAHIVGEGTIASLITALCGLIVGVAFYAIIMLATHTADEALGYSFDRIRTRLHMKR